MAKKKTATEAGAKAFEDGTPFNDCPHPTGKIERLDWMNGWLDAWGSHRIKSIRTRLNMGDNEHAKVDDPKAGSKRQ